MIYYDNNYRLLSANEYLRAKIFLKLGLTMLVYTCPYCGEEDVTLWLKGRCSNTDGYPRVPRTLKCGRCGDRFSYTVHRPNDNHIDQYEAITGEHVDRESL